MNNCNNTINQLYEIIEQAVKNKTPVATQSHLNEYSQSLFFQCINLDTNKTTMDYRIKIRLMLNQTIVRFVAFPTQIHLKWDISLIVCACQGCQNLIHYYFNQDKIEDDKKILLKDMIGN